MRVFLAVMCALIMILAGRIKCRGMTRRAQMLRKVELFLKLMRPRTEYLHEPLSKTVSILSDHSGLSELTFLKECARACEEGTVFPKAWNDAVRGVARTTLGKDDAELLLSLGEAVSSANAADISSVLSMYEASFQRSAETAEKTAEADGKTYMSIFSAAGVLLGIIII